MPESQAKLHKHPLHNPRNGYHQAIFGYRLVAGDTIGPEDVYDSTSGQWSIGPEPCVGLPIGVGVNAIWIRPMDEPFSFKVSYEDSGFVGICSRWPSLSWCADSEECALEGIRQVVAEAIYEDQDTSLVLP